MKLFWCPKTRAARAVWMLEEVGCDYEKVLIDIRDSKARGQPDFLTASPMGKVPALEDGENRMAESAAICLYLADRYASGRLAPPIDADDRGEFLYWMFFSPGVIEPCMAERFGTAQESRSAHGWGDFDSMIKTLEARLHSRDWLMGDAFTAADVMVGSTCAFLQMFGIMPESPILAAYLDRCAAREAYQRGFVEEADS